MRIDRQATERERHREMKGKKEWEKASWSHSPWHGLQCQPTPVAITLWPRPRYYLKPNKYQALNVTARTPRPHLHQSVSRVSNHPFSFLGRQIHLPHSYTLLHTPIRPLTTTLRGGTVQQIYDPPVSGWARFIDISCQLSFWEIAHRINFNYVLMLNILETLNFMVGDAHSSMSIYQVLGALLKDPFF